MQPDQGDHAPPVGLLGASDLATKLDGELCLGQHARLHIWHEARRRRRRAFDLRSHSRQQLTEGERFDQVVVGAKAHPGDDVLSVTSAREQDYGQGLGRGLRAKPLQELEPVHVGHGHVADHQVRRRLGQQRQRLLTVGRVGNRASGCRQGTADDLSKHRLIVHDEDRRLDTVRLSPGRDLGLCVVWPGRLHSGCPAR